MKASILKSNGRIKDIEPKNQTDFSLEEAQGVVGGYVEVVRIPQDRTKIMLVNEEGLIHSLPYNKIATMIAGQHIVGDVLVCRTEQFK
jgi:hypothetical protein